MVASGVSPWDYSAKILQPSQCGGTNMEIMHKAANCRRSAGA